MRICDWKRVLAAAAAGVCLSGVALGDLDSTAVVRQSVRLVAPQLSAPDNFYAWNAYCQADAAESPFMEEGPTAPLPEDERYEQPSSEPPLLPIAQPEEAADDEYEDIAPVYQPQISAPADPQPWRLPQPRALQALGINTSGWFQAGMTLNGEAPNDIYNGPMLLNDQHGQLQMHQLWLAFERPVNTGGYGAGIGGRFDIFYGTDWRAAYCHGMGLEDRINGLNQLYGLALPQFYLEAAYNDLSVKMGRMAGIFGYESVVPLMNFFYSHGYQLCYAEPILITGLMADYKLTDQWSVLAGFHQGFNRFEDDNGCLNFQGGVRWTSTNKKVSLAYSLDVGKRDPAGLQDQYAHSIVAKLQLTEKLLYVLQNDQGFLNGVAGGADAEWYGIGQYLIYTINPKWSAGTRIEWFRDDDGTRVFGVGNLPHARGWMGAPGYAGSFTALTFGLNWKPKPNFIFRPEIRWDWYDGLPNPNGPYPLPFDDGNSSSQFTLAADMMFTF